MNDPFSKNTRKYLDWNKNLQLEANPEQRSLIGVTRPSRSQIYARINDLARWEDELGFAYVGEKQWLETLANRSALAYHEWVEEQFQSVVFSPSDPNRSRKTYQDGCVCWLTMDLSLLVSFDEIEAQSLEIEDLSLHVMVCDAGLQSDQLQMAFYVIHNLCYFRLQLGRFAPDYCFHQLVIREDPTYWRITVIDRAGPIDVDYKGLNETPLPRK